MTAKNLFGILTATAMLATSPLALAQNKKDKNSKGNRETVAKPLSEKEQRKKPISSAKS